LNFVALDDASNVQTDIETFVLNIEISSILVLKASTTSDISFNFLDLKSYAAGVAQYSATVLEVSSNVGWDLIGYGTSTRNEANANNPYWDNLTSYGTGGSVDIPLNALQINQVPANPFGGDDYSQAFSSTSVLSGPNTIEVARGSGVPTPESPGTGAKTIAGNWDLALGAGNFIAPGSYKIPSVDWDVDDFRYVMSYKIVPRLPAMFPDGEGAAGAMTTYARPGVYAMFVKYLLTEDQ